MPSSLCARSAAARPCGNANGWMDPSLLTHACVRYGAMKRGQEGKRKRADGLNASSPALLYWVFPPPVVIHHK